MASKSTGKSPGMGSQSLACHWLRRIQCIEYSQHYAMSNYHVDPLAEQATLRCSLHGNLSVLKGGKAASDP